MSASIDCVVNLAPEPIEVTVLSSTVDVSLGTQGPQGPPGTNGANGSAGPQGPMGAIGPAGPQGIQGPIGLIGPQGAASTVPGPQGPAGPKGATGNQGPAGATGPVSTVPGPQGPIGATGPAGPQGPIGLTGAAGSQGAQGAQGIQGTQGVQGPTGAVGAASTVPGPAGSAGPTGAKGDTGATGATGNQGLQGAIGPAGPTGTTGATGPQGLQGAPGATGPQGPQGQGVNVKGTVATSANLPTVGNTVGDMWITSNTGHGWVWQTNLTWLDVGPIQGPPGPTGPQGPTGATGGQGPQGAQGIAGATGPQGPIGQTGPASTVPGPTGPTGPTGNTGPQGVQGASGPPGSAGQGYLWRGPWVNTTSYNPYDTVSRSGSSYVGISAANVGHDPATDPGTNWQLIAQIGATGSQGPQGTAGATGAQGPAGGTGPAGPTGSAGAQGPQGNTGSTGATGPAGPSAISANANNKATLGSDSLILVQGTATGVAATTHAQTVSGDDPQLTNARTPITHGATHVAGDLVPLVTPTVPGLMPAGGLGRPVVLGETAADPVFTSGIIVPRYANHPDQIWAYGAFDDHFDSPSSGTPNAKWVNSQTSGILTPVYTQAGSKLCIGGGSPVSSSTIYSNTVTQQLPIQTNHTITLKVLGTLFVNAGASGSGGITSILFNLAYGANAGGIQAKLFFYFNPAGTYVAFCQIWTGAAYGTTFLNLSAAAIPPYWSFVYNTTNTTISVSSDGITWIPIAVVPAATSGFGTNAPTQFVMGISATFLGIGFAQFDWIKHV